MTSSRLEKLSALLTQSPDDSFLLFALAKEWEGLNEPEKALAYFQQLLEKDETYTGAYYHLGKLLEEQGRHLEAIKTYEKGMACAERQQDFHSLRELKEALQGLLQ